MRTRAAVLLAAGKPFEVVELDLDGPKQGEVLIRLAAAGLCHSDLHLLTGDMPSRLPMVGGHEGAGIVEEVGAGVTKVKPGDHVVCSFIPSCGVCRYCSTGRQNLCDLGANLLDGQLLDGTFRFHHEGEDVGGMCSVGTFSENSTLSEHSVVKIDDWLPLETAALVSCGVPTGWGSAVHTGNVRAGDTTVVYGAGGIGMNAVQGAALAGAKYVVVVEPQEFKRNAAPTFGAIHVFADAGAAHETVVQAAFAAVGKGGTVVVTGVSPSGELTVHVSGEELTFWQKTIKGSLFGECNPQHDIKSCSASTNRAA